MENKQYTKEEIEKLFNVKLDDFGWTLIQEMTKKPFQYTPLLSKEQLKKRMEKEISLPDKCLVHRYLYYVENEPIITDMQYDIMEKESRKIAEETHPINKPGSSLKSSYPNYVIKLAEEWKKEK